MALVDVFPENPFTPSLPYASAAQLPVTVPWGGKALQMGTPLIVGSQPQDTQFLEDRCAFSSDSLKKTSLTFRHVSRGMITESNTHTAAARHEHTSFSIQAQIGGSVIGVSGRGNYEARGATNQDDTAEDELTPQSHGQIVNASFRTEYQSGWIGFVSPPRLSPLALELLHTHDDPHTAFRERFGDYYVGAYLLGGANAQLVSSNDIAASASKDLSGKGEVRFLGFKKEKKFDSHEKADAAFGQIRLTGYDSLEAWECDHQENEDVRLIHQVADENEKRCRSLIGRVNGKVEMFQLKDGGVVSVELCEGICRAHLVVQILLLPYKKLREYAVAVLANASGTDAVDSGSHMASTPAGKA
ncbi:uncharacterized protein N7483_012891 [Penicillium malachiteum]|uniref:uncharacterized protein n=1 Tax=Penicillium malachiteum TaxID=1324776 RepID=UPI00254664E9|nr:uncharacterized protein N7483_012891 [Penicillium malachiteum]KAJ5715710.1 hypothetical protein N7483_012891 [Penicillium malachiteum]